ncbi:hypothetical protein FB451DRAFT_1193775 [Mycena latifolia]|nr:hypothetical protein FB451DRAFT_1193775 [Mycena latifolia]
MSKYVGAHLNEVDVRSQEGLRSNTGKTCLEDRTNVVEIKDKDSAEYFQHISESREIPMYNDGCLGRTNIEVDAFLVRAHQTKQSSMLVAHFSLLPPPSIHPLASDNGNGQRDIFPEAHSFIAPLLPTLLVIPLPLRIPLKPISSLSHRLCKKPPQSCYLAKLFQDVKVLIIKPFPQPPPPQVSICRKSRVLYASPLFHVPVGQLSAHDVAAVLFHFRTPNAPCRASAGPRLPLPPSDLLAKPRGPAAPKARAGAEDAHTTIRYTRIVIFFNL